MERFAEDNREEEEDEEEEVKEEEEEGGNKCTTSWVTTSRNNSTCFVFATVLSYIMHMSSTLTREDKERDGRSDPEDWYKGERAMRKHTGQRMRLRQ